jgi:hypothetical protein
MTTSAATSATGQTRELVRHGIATIAYRGAKAIRGAQNSFATYHIGDKTRTPAQILTHIGDLFVWARAAVQGNPEWNESKPLAWADEKERFFSSLKNFDDYLASEQAIQITPEKLLQSPIADALTHIGQIAMLRRLAGSPISGENFLEAEITIGRVGFEQAAPKEEFV